MVNNRTIECWIEEHQDEIWTEYYESGACYYTSLEWFAEDLFDRVMEGKNGTA